jgi:hypothetical protein
MKMRYISRKLAMVAGSGDVKPLNGSSQQDGWRRAGTLPGARPTNWSREGASVRRAEERCCTTWRPALKDNGSMGSRRVARCPVLNYDLNSLKMVKLVSEAEARCRDAWAGAKRGQLAFWPTLGMSRGVGAESTRYGLRFCYIILL